MTIDTSPNDLERIALRVREHIIRMATDGGCFIGALLVEALVVVPAAAARNVARGTRSYLIGSVAVAFLAGAGGLGGPTATATITVTYKVSPDTAADPAVPNSASGSSTAGNALASAPAVSVSVDIAGARLIIMSVATTPAMARASLWPLVANSTTTSGFQA